VYQNVCVLFDRVYHTRHGLMTMITAPTCLHGTFVDASLQSAQWRTGGVAIIAIVTIQTHVVPSGAGGGCWGCWKLQLSNDNIAQTQWFAYLEEGRGAMAMVGERDPYIHSYIFDRKCSLLLWSTGIRGVFVNNYKRCSK
jgi:hypothetical protein